MAAPSLLLPPLHPNLPGLMLFPVHQSGFIPHAFTHMYG